MKFSLTNLPSLNLYTCEWFSQDGYIFSLGNNLYHSNSISSKFIYIGCFPESRIKQFVTRFSIVRRFLRSTFYNVLPLNNGTYFVSYGKQIGVIKEKRFIPFTEIEKPFRILRSASAIDNKGNVFFGEYSSNNERKPVKIYKYSYAENLLKVVYEFPAGTIRHIHGIYFDKYTNFLWCLSGDIGAENRISYSKDEFKTITTIGSGDESWRAVSILFTEKYFYYGMDAEYAENYIIKVKRSDHSRKKIVKVNGPVYYSYKFNGFLIFAVTAELCPSQVDKSAALYALDQDDNVTRIIDFEKDFFSVKYFLPGAFYFPAGPGINQSLLINTVALKNSASNTFYLKN
jgi:hypothetical protein